MVGKVKSFKEFVNEQVNNGSSTSNYLMVDILRSLPFIKYVDRPSGPFLHTIDLSITDEKYLNDLRNVVDDNNWYIERGRDRRFVISQKYIKDAEIEIPDKLYHITPTKNIESILSNGLKPKSEDFRHKYPPRIYVSDNIQSLKPLSKELSKWKDDDDYTIVEIDTNGLNFTLYKDSTSAYKGHYYIQDIDKIPSGNIYIL